MATEWKKIYLDLRAIKYDPAKLYLRQLENTLDLTKWINDGIVEGTIDTGFIPFSLNGLDELVQTIEVTENGTNVTLTNDGISEHYLNIPIASALNTGKLSAADWIRFDAAATPVLGDLLSNSNAANIIGGTNAVIGGNVTLDFNAADGADDGILTSADWISFSSKLGTASNGLTVTGTLVELGGALTKNTTVSGAFNLGFTNNRVGIGIASALYRLDTLLGTGEAAYIRSTNISFNITDGAFTNGYYNLNTGVSSNAYHRFYIANSNTVNHADNYTDLLVSSFGNGGMTFRSYSNVAALGGNALKNLITGDNIYIGSGASSGTLYLGGNTGSGSTVTFASSISTFTIPLGTVANFASTTFNLNYAGVATVGASGAASALPAQPLGYAEIKVNGTNVKIPYYNA